MSVKIETENVKETEASAELVRELMAALGRGVQIGVVNWIDDGWILPLVNWRFRQSTSKYTESIKKGNR